MSRIARKIARTILPQKSRERLVESLAEKLRVNVWPIALKQLGILQYKTDLESGEHYLLSTVLPHFVPANGLFFDVGANVGQTAIKLRSRFPSGQIISFEPNPQTFERLQKATSALNVKTENVGFSAEKGTLNLWVYPEQQTTAHASIYKEVITELHGSGTAVEVAINLETLDDFCRERSIEKIDFLKVDTEGHEMEVLKGASGLLGRDAIRLLQFEFNEMNLVSRVFLRDFHNLLAAKFRLFRLHQGGLISVEHYSPSQEIFQFQNFLAIHKSCGDIPPQMIRS